MNGRPETQTQGWMTPLRYPGSSLVLTERTATALRLRTDVHGVRPRGNGMNVLQPVRGWCETTSTYRTRTYVGKLNVFFSVYIYTFSLMPVWLRSETNCVCLHHRSISWLLYTGTTSLETGRRVWKGLLIIGAGLQYPWGLWQPLKICPNSTPKPCWERRNIFIRNKTFQTRTP